MQRSQLSQLSAQRLPLIKQKYSPIHTLKSYENDHVSPMSEGWGHYLLQQCNHLSYNVRFEHHSSQCLATHIRQPLNFFWLRGINRHTGCAQKEHEKGCRLHHKINVDFLVIQVKTWNWTSQCEHGNQDSDGSGLLSTSASLHTEYKWASISM